MDTMTMAGAALIVTDAMLNKLGMAQIFKMH
jgi:hypothetical protein